jgi:transmembrane sensor
VVDQAADSVSKTRVLGDDAEAWKQGKLVFEEEPFDSAIERVNRYASNKVVDLSDVSDRAPITGVFTAGDTRLFAEAVSAELSLRLDRAQNGDFVLSSR